MSLLAAGEARQWAGRSGDMHVKNPEIYYPLPADAAVEIELIVEVSG
jgi:hypothetical protein